MATANPTGSKNQLYCDIVADLEDRSDWENRQALWYKMRTAGVRRARKPWPGAADMHVPVGDTIINKLKAYYIQWIFGPELLASFYALEKQGDSYESAVAQWFDYQVRTKSNFARAAVCAVDSILQNGMGFLKTYYDQDRGELAFASIHPYFVIMPVYSDVESLDRLTHVMQLSEAEYLRCAETRGYNTDQTFIDSIKGEGKPDANYEQTRYTAEGLSYSRLKDLIILWETYEVESDGQIKVHTFSPLQPDEPARSTFRLPYAHKEIPILQLNYELIDTSVYSSRGVMELVQMYEASSCKMWNEKLDFMSIANRPVLSSQGGSVNAQNIRWEPGAVYDAVLQLVQQPAPPIDFDQEIQATRSYAEQRVGIPDFGLGQENQPQKNRTATETNAITTVMQQSNDLRARVLKGGISGVFNQSWELLKQYKKDDLDFFWRKKRVTLPDAAFDNAYVLQPNGSVDGYSRDREIQKLMQLRQLAQGSPWLKVWEIDRKIVELMDADWVAVLYQEPEEAQADQQEQQAIENSVMSDGFLPNVKPTDEHVQHLTILDGFVGWRQKQGAPIPPVLLPIFLQHASAHVQAARADPQYMKQNGPAIAQFANKIAVTQRQLAQGQQAQAAAAAAMTNLRGGGPGAPPGPLEPPVPPVPGTVPTAGPSMPPGGIPPAVPNGSTP